MQEFGSPNQFESSTACAQASRTSIASLAPLVEQLEQLWANEDRIADRLGTNAPESERYRAASEQVGRAHFIISEIAAGAAADTERRHALDRARDSAFEEERAFFNVSSERVGPRTD